MSWVAVAVGGSAILSGYLNNQAAGDAADAQIQAANRASETQRYMYDTTRKDMAPWRQVGVDALSDIGRNKEYINQTFSGGELANDQGYQFRLQEGQKALERSAAAKGGLNSGRMMKDLARFSQGVASDEYGRAYERFNADRDRRFNRLASLAGIGQTATQSTNSAGMNYANNVSQNQIGAGNATAAARVGGANAITGAINNGANTWMQYQMMNRLFPSSIPNTDPA